MKSGFTMKISQIFRARASAQSSERTPKFIYTVYIQKRFKYFYLMGSALRSVFGVVKILEFVANERNVPRDKAILRHETSCHHIKMKGPNCNSIP